MTNEEILQIAKRCYPVGTEYYGAYAVKGIKDKKSALRKVTSENYDEPGIGGHIHEPSTGQDFIYHSNRWAEIVLPEPKLGMKVVRGPKYAKGYVLNDEAGYIVEILKDTSFRVNWENTGIDGTNTMCMGGVIPVVGKNSNKEEPEYKLGDIVFARKDELGVIVSENELVRHFSDDLSSYSNIIRKATKDEISIELKKILKSRFPNGVKVLSLYGSERTLDCSNFVVEFMNGISCYDNKGGTKILSVKNDQIKWAEIIGAPVKKEPEMEWIPTYENQIDCPTHIVRSLTGDSFNGFKKGDIFKARLNSVSSSFIIRDKVGRARSLVPEEVKIIEEIGEVVTPSSNDTQIKSSQNGTSEEVQNAIEQISGRDEQGAIIIQSKQSKIEVRDFDPGYSRVIVRSKRKIRISEG